MFTEASVEAGLRSHVPRHSSCDVEVDGIFENLLNRSQLDKPTGHINLTLASEGRSRRRVLEYTYVRTTADP